VSIESPSTIIIAIAAVELMDKMRDGWHEVSLKFIANERLPQNNILNSPVVDSK
jgi:hypothetical protein